MCQQVQSVTLQTAVLMTVKEFAGLGKPFSVHDITRAIRSKTSHGELEIPEAEIFGAPFRFDISHAKVKTVFDELRRTGVFDSEFSLSRNFNGTYFEYTPSPVGDPFVQASTTSTQTNSVSSPSLTYTIPSTQQTITTPVVPGAVRPSRNEIRKRIDSYLGRCKRATLKEIQSAIKRGNMSTGWTCEELEDIITTDLGGQITTDLDAQSKSVVTR